MGRQPTIDEVVEESEGVRRGSPRSVLVAGQA